MSADDPASVLEFMGVKVTITPSAGRDGAVVVFVDTPDMEPDASDGGPGLRILLNDEPVFAGVEFLCEDCGVNPEDPNHADVHYHEVN